MLVWAIDTDSKGAVSVLMPDMLAVAHLPNMQIDAGISKKTKKMKKRTRLDPDKFIELFQKLAATYTPTHVVFEAQRGLPDQHAVATFSFGETNGFIRGVVKTLLANKPVTYLEFSGAHWKASLGLSADKKEARSVAFTLCPALAKLYKDVEKNNSICESFLMGLYAISATTFDATTLTRYKNTDKTVITV